MRISDWSSDVCSSDVEVSMRNLDEFTITDEALRRIAATPDTRIKEIMTSFIRHLHDFARDVRLTEPEWLAGILFLTRTGHLCSDARQEFSLLSDQPGLSHDRKRTRLNSTPSC